MLFRSAVMTPTECTNSKELTSRHRYWHFLGEDKRLRYRDGRKVEIGKTIKVSCQPVLCKSGLHASYRAIDALQYARGPIVCRVMLGGTLIVGDDKVAATERTVLAMADATTVLHEFACWCATRALKTANVTDERSWNAISTKLKWLRGEATDEDLSAAESAAWSAAESAARSAAESAAWSAAGSASWSAAESAAWSAAGSAQNTYLESKLKALLKATGR